MSIENDFLEIVDNNEIADVFSMFHDGGLAGLQKNEESIIIQVDCRYLAEMFQDGFKNFYVELIGLDNCKFVDWDEEVRDDLTYIFATDKEIARSEIIDSAVVIYVNKNYDDSLGGEIRFNVDSIKIYNENMKPLSFTQLVIANDKYWGKFNSKK